MNSDEPASIVLGDGRSIHAIVEPGFGAIADVFVENFVLRGDLGASCSVMVDGRPVAELWGGTADRRTGRAQTRRTAAVVFSCSKGLLAACAYRLVDRGLLDLDQAVASYWPEFARCGKSQITVRHVLSHRAGLAALDRDLTRSDALDWDVVIRAIEGQPPLSAPEDGFTYHSLTYGWLVGELIRRRSGRTPGQYLEEEVAGPLGLRMWIGVPADVDDIGWMEAPLPDDGSAEAQLTAELLDDHPIVGRSLSMGGAWPFPADDTGHVVFNDLDIQQAEVPGANGVCSARALAQFYASCLGYAGQPGLLSRSSIADALVPRSTGPQLTGIPDDGARWGTGFQIASPPTQPMLGSTSFGHAGAGGQLGFADVESGAAFAYVTNQMGGYGDVRASELTAALARCL